MAASARRPALRSRPLMAAVALTAIALFALWTASPAAASPQMQSTGSSFAAVAIQEWVGESSTLYGLNINWQVSSSVIGLNDFAQNQVDFAASDIPYSSQQSTYYPSIPYEYMPDVAGGLSFMYNLTGNNGQQITSLNLNAQTIDKIFLGEITNWTNSAITSLNPQLAGDLPNEKIVPVYRTDASGENYLLSDYLLHQDGADFTAAQSNFHTFDPGSPTAIWPTPTPGFSYSQQEYPGWAQNNLVGQNGSDNLADYVASLSSQGSIGYVETAYAKEHNFPVASLINASGNPVQPTSLNVATALEAAILHPDLTQDLTNVYTNTLPNAYPLSAYSYLVTPCSPSLAAAQGTNCAADPNGAASTFPSGKGNALGTFVGFLACAGQDQMATLGYSPLPPNLVQEDFDAIGRLNGGVQPPPVSAATCKNPYVDGQIPLPGEPTIVGQSGGGTTGVISSLGATSQDTSGGHGGAGSLGSGGAGSGSGSKGSGSGSGSSKLTAAETAAGDVVAANGQIAKSLKGGTNQFLRADGLVSALRGIGGIATLYMLGWILLAGALFVGLPLLISRRRRNAGAGAATPSGKTEGSP